MLAKHEQRILDCPSCEATGYANVPGNVRCKLCGGDCQIVITVEVGATGEDEDEAISALREKRKQREHEGPDRTDFEESMRDEHRTEE